MIKPASAALGCLLLLSSCGGSEPRLAPVVNSESFSDLAAQPDSTPEVRLAPETQPGVAAKPDPLAELESSVLVPNVVLNFARGAEDACIAALALTSDGQLSTQGFTYTDKTCRRIIDSVPIPDLPENDIDTAYLRGFQEMLGIMFRPGTLCAANGECFVKEDVLPVLP